MYNSTKESLINYPAHSDCVEKALANYGLLFQVKQDIFTFLFEKGNTDKVLADILDGYFEENKAFRSDGTAYQGFINWKPVIFKKDVDSVQQRVAYSPSNEYLFDKNMNPLTYGEPL